ncbi:hypothetical protein B6A14_08400 [Polynucleobacter hirudinilacicola]|uniref:Schlafen AlbA-2 domain-containing protein n=1 Tax=Polynucleobacter hirudinilacicola TaxID=1743166 RepID=A0A210RXX6_9BURK|nr:RNA-binding domain-containing protein [Polynucleobacter hirudinilacicola]OWF65777.1 hypothetical protein B6A14_08400 [Polynucleobacter hirudinilacicola]
MEISAFNKEIITSFSNTFIEMSGAKSCLQINHSEHKLFNNLKCQKLDTTHYKTEALPTTGHWDIIFGDFPFGMTPGSLQDANPRLSYSINAILSILKHLNEGGYAIFTAEPSALQHNVKSIRHHLEFVGCEVAAIFATPDSLLKHYTSIKVPLIVLKKGQVDKEFIAEIDSAIQSERLVQSFFDKTEGQNLLTGVWVEKNSFEGFYRWKIQQQIHSLQSEYKNFNKLSIEDISDSVNLCKLNEQFLEADNAIYIPKLGANPVVGDINQVKIKHQNVIQVICKQDLVDATYLVYFFGSTLGRLIIDSLRSQSFIPSISKSDILKTEIAIPPLDVQREIVSSISKLNFIKNKISQFEENLALNPISSQNELNQIDSILEAVGELANPDKIKSLIRAGESKSVEFKQTFSLDVERQVKEPRIEDSAIKTIAAFLNSDGGTLLVGVHDSGEITGNEVEIDKFFKSTDKFLLHVKNRIKTRIGEQFYPFINQHLVSVEGKLVLMVECDPSPDEVFVDEKDFYVRTNPATDKLEGRKLSDYIKHRFKH